MTSGSSSQKVEVPQGGGVEKKEGLAPVARMILEKIFRTDYFQKLYELIREKCNLVYSGKGTPADVEFVKKEISKHSEEVDKNYAPEVAEIAKNYLRKLSQTMPVSEASESKIV